MRKLNTFTGAMYLTCLILYLDSRTRMYEALFDPTKVLIAGGIFFALFLVTTLTKEK